MVRNRMMTWTLALLGSLFLATLAQAAIYTPANAGPAQEEVLAALTQYAGGELPFTTVPDDGTVDARIAQRLYEEAPSPRAVAVVAAAQLRLAQGWLMRGSVERGPLALLLVQTTARQVELSLGEARLAVEVNRAFLYPYLHLASPERWQCTSAEVLMGCALARTEATGDLALMREAFDLLIVSTTDRESADGTRLVYAGVLAKAGELRAALAQLDAIAPDTRLHTVPGVRARITAQLAALP